MPKINCKPKVKGFIFKSSTVRKVRSVRLTDEVYAYFQGKAQEKDITFADLLESIATQDLLKGSDKENLLEYSKALLFDKTVVRPRDRWSVKKVLSKLFGVEDYHYKNIKR